jgi:hypothetical protein
MADPPIDIQTLTTVGGTRAGSYRALSEDVLVAVPTPGYIQSVEGARASLAELVRIAEQRGRRQALVIVVDNVTSQDAASRRLWQRELDPGLLCGLALSCGSLLARAIGSFYIGLRRPTVETRMFASVREALKWCDLRVTSHGGPLDPG